MAKTREEARKEMAPSAVDYEVSEHVHEATKRRRRAVQLDSSPRQDEALVSALLSVSFELAAIRAILYAAEERSE